MEQLHILRGAWEILLHFSQKMQSTDASLLVPEDGTLRDTTYLVGCFCGGGNHSHKRHLCGSDPSHFLSRCHQYSPHCPLCCHSFSIPTRPFHPALLRILSKILLSLSPPLTFIEHLLNTRHYVNFCLHNP